VDGDLPHQHKTGGRGTVAGKSGEQGVIVEEALAGERLSRIRRLIQTPLQFFVALTCNELVLF